MNPDSSNTRLDAADAIAEMDRAMGALRYELPESVWHDVDGRYRRVRSLAASRGVVPPQPPSALRFAAAMSCLANFNIRAVGGFRQEDVPGITAAIMKAADDAAAVPLLVDPDLDEIEKRAPKQVLIIGERYKPNWFGRCSCCSRGVRPATNGRRLMGTKNNPGEFDCYENAAPDEPMFVLLGRDADAPILVDLWASLRERDGEVPAKVAEARDCADAMRGWTAFAEQPTGDEQ